MPVRYTVQPVYTGGKAGVKAPFEGTDDTLLGVRWCLEADAMYVIVRKVEDNG